MESQDFATKRNITQFKIYQYDKDEDEENA